MPTYTSMGPGGDVLLYNTLPEAEYMYGCTPTAVAMILGYYDLYGYRGTNLSNLIEGIVALKSRGTDGNSHDMDAFDTALGNATATSSYVYRFHSRNGTPTTSVQELEYSFANGGAGPDIRTDVWDCIADYLGTGQYWRGNGNLSTTVTYCSLEDLLTKSYNNIRITDGVNTRIISYKDTSMMYGLYLYVQARGYQMDFEISGTYQVDCDGGDFTFEDYMREIDSGRPVLISIEGHSMAGYGYNPSTREIIFDDCYASGQRMVWDGAYYYGGGNRKLQSITVIGINVTGDVDLALVENAGSPEKVILSNLSGARASADYCFDGSTVYLTYSIRNTGSKESRDFYTAVRIDGNLVSSGSVYSISAQTTRKYQNVSLGKLAVGMHNVRVTVDEDNTVQELSGSNNVAEKSILVLKTGTGIVSGTQNVNNSRTIRDTYVQGGGTLNLFNGSAFDTILRGRITSSAADGTVWFLTGKANVSRGGCLSGTDIYDYGEARISGGGAAVDTRLFANGRTSVFSGGVASNTTMASGAKLDVYSGGRITGLFHAEDGASATFYDGSILDFDLSSVTPGAATRAILPSNLRGIPIYTLTVAGAQKNGRYKLAENAAGFDQTISVQAASGESLGTLTVGQTAYIDGVKYALALDDDLLSVQVGDIAVSAARGDRDGSGVSDVMFVWTGNTYIHGYWMNGKSDWWSANAASVSSDWENLGSYDMSGDGKADAVMFGNVVVNGVKGAYIGYYRNGDDNASGWGSIGYLNNADDIAWKNKVGNLTGNDSGANSIVWYAPELYALGAWTDGTDSWVTLSGDFGGDAWTLAGCGDFSGSGCDSVLMTYNSGQMFYTVGLDGSPRSLGNADWSGWEVRAIADFAGDGVDDIVLFHKGSGSMVMLKDGSTDRYTPIGQLNPADWFVAGAGDYDGDGRDDLLVRQYSSGMLGYYESGDTSRWVEMGRGVGMEWTVIA